MEQWWLGQERWRETKLGSWPRTGPARLGPGAINYNLIEGYRGDPALTKRRTEVVIEEGVPFSLSFFPVRELRQVEQYWSWRGAAARIA